MVKYFTRLYGQLIRELNSDHPEYRMVELLSLSPLGTMIDKRTLRFIRLDAEEKVCEYFLDILISDGCGDADSVLGVDIIFAKNSHHHTCKIRYKTNSDCNEYTHKVGMRTTRIDVKTMLELGYGR